MKSNATKEQCLQICETKNKTLNKQFVVVKDRGNYHVHMATSVPGDLKNCIVGESICQIQNNAFTSAECLTCERVMCRAYIGN